MSNSKQHLEQMLKDLIEQAAEVDLEPKLASLWWTSTYAFEEKEDMMVSHKVATKSLLQRIRDIGMWDESSRETCDGVEERMQSATEGHQDKQKQGSVAILAQAISCSSVRGVFPDHDFFLVFSCPSVYDPVLQFPTCSHGKH